MKIFSVMLLIVLVGVGIYFFSNQSSSKDYQTPQSQFVEQKKEFSIRDSRYLHYDQSVLTETSGKKRVLFFFANWCPTCIPADADFTKNVSKIPEDVVLIRVNYNDTETDQEEKDLAKKYGVTYQHTFVQIDADGREVTKWNGGQIEELLSNLK